MQLNYETAQIAQECIFQGLLNRLSEEERSDLFQTAVQGVSVRPGQHAGRSAVSGSYGVQTGLPTVVYQMSDENLTKWARIDGMTNRVPGTVTIVRLILQRHEQAHLA
jgi:hypothetical protein